MRRLFSYFLVFAFLVSLMGCKANLSLTELDLLTPDGTPFDTSITAGKAVFINYWATWCKPCIDEMPSIQNLERTLDPEKVVFLLVSDQSLAKINGFLKDKDYSLHFVKKVLKPGEEGRKSFPWTLLLGPEGNVLFEKTGSAQWDSPEAVKKMKSLINTQLEAR